MARKKNADAEELRDFLDDIDGKNKGKEVGPDDRDSLGLDGNFADPLNDISDINMNDSNIYSLDTDAKGPNEITTGESAWAKTEAGSSAQNDNQGSIDEFRPGFPPGFGQKITAPLQNASTSGGTRSE